MAKNKKLPAKTEKVDERLVSNALHEISLIHHDKTHEVVYVIGECLCRHFYNDDIEKIRKNKPVHGKSLNRLMSECGSQINGLSRAWLYASVKLLVDRKDLDGYEGYEKLSVSHKHALLQVKGTEAKKELIDQIINSDLSVRKAIELTTKYLEENPKVRVTKKKQKKKTLKQLLKQPHLLGTPKFRHLKRYSNLDKMTEQELEIIHALTIEQWRATQRQIGELKQGAKELGDVLYYFELQDLDRKQEEYNAKKQRKIDEEYAAREQQENMFSKQTEE